MHPKGVVGIADFSRSRMFAHTLLFENLGSLRIILFSWVKPFIIVMSLFVSLLYTIHSI